MFGELIGLWAAEVWAMMGRPNPLRLIELGPGRGTLMSDALRAARIVPEFRAALDVTLVETSPALAEIQHDTLLTAGAPIAWAPTLAEAPGGPGDHHRQRVPRRAAGAPIRAQPQPLARADGVASTSPANSPSRPAASRSRSSRRAGEEGDIIETCPAAHRLMYELGGAARASRAGSRCSSTTATPSPAIGDTLQAVRGHRMVDPLVEPGECDITAHVDFAAMARSARAAGAAVYGPIDQGDFLRAIGIDTRTQALAEPRARARPRSSKQARRRLVGKDAGEMGALFKAMVVANRNLPAAARLRDGADGEPPHASTPRRSTLPGVRHAFFTREGGVSEGVYASLNGGVGSRDAPRRSRENRARMAAALGLAPERLLVPYQVHSPDVVDRLGALGARTARPRCDGIVTATPGLGARRHRRRLRHDPVRRRRGAASSAPRMPAGRARATASSRRPSRRWRRSARAPATSSPRSGPCIAQASYEVGPEFVAAFARPTPRRRAIFAPSRNAGRAMFDLHGYIGAARRARAASAASSDLGLDTYADEARFFSYRRKTHRGEADYGRLVSAIALV